MASFYFFGPPAVEHSGGSEVYPLSKASAFLAYLALDGGWIPRESLAFFLRPEADAEVARGYVRKLLFGARRFPWSQALEADPERVRFHVDTDVRRFRRAVDEWRWHEALELYRGPLLEGMEASALPTLEAWLSEERFALERQRDRAGEGYAADLESAGDHRAAAEAAASVRRRDPFAETAAQLEIRNAYLAGDRQRALQVATTFCDGLEREFETAPLDATLELIQRVRNSELVESAEPSRRFGRRRSDRRWMERTSQDRLDELRTLLQRPTSRLLDFVPDRQGGGELLVVAQRVDDDRVAALAVLELTERLVGEGAYRRALELCRLLLDRPDLSVRLRQRVERQLEILGERLADVDIEPLLRSSAAP